MNKLYIDEYTKAQATEYANNEARLGGFAEGSAQWKKAFKRYITYAVGAMSVGRNPGFKKNPNARYKPFITLYPEVFRESGFAGTAAKKYRQKDGSIGAPLSEMEGRIIGAITTLSKLFENVVLDVKTSTKGRKQGKILNEDMSDLQFPNREEFATKEEHEAAVRDVLYQWMVRDLVTTAIIETLQPFWTMKKSDVEEIMLPVDEALKKASVQTIIKSGREDFIRALRKAIGVKYNLPFRKAVEG